MLEIALMIEGQNGLNWTRWKRIAKLAEELGFFGLYRSDHYTNANPPDLDSLELWVSLTWLATNTEHIQFGPLVSPMSFRHPSMTARIASAVDDLSGGRLTLGLGAGWQEREHNNFGLNLLDVGGRFNRFEEGLEVITRLLQSETPINYQGKFFQLKDAILLPRPTRSEGPPILIGGNGRMRTLPLVARFADEWNAVYVNADQFASLSRRLDRLLLAEGKQPADVLRTLMTGCIYGRTPDEVTKRVKDRTNGRYTPDDLIDRGLMVGTGEQIIKQLEHLSQSGVQRIMLQWLDLDDMDRLAALAEAVLPHF